MELTVSVTEVAELFKAIQEKPSSLFEMMRMDVQEEVGKYLTTLMDAELTHHLGREKYERIEGDANHRNGTYSRRFCIKGIGEVELRIPRDRDGEFKTQVVPRSQQYEDAITEDLSLMYLTGISTRSLSLISRRLIGRNISHQEVSKANKELSEAIERWRSRDLSNEAIKYIYVDGVIFSMRVSKSIEKVPVLVAIGVSENGSKLVRQRVSGQVAGVLPGPEKSRTKRHRRTIRHHGWPLWPGESVPRRVFPGEGAAVPGSCGPERPDEDATENKAAGC